VLNSIEGMLNLMVGTISSIKVMKQDEINWKGNKFNTGVLFNIYKQVKYISAV